MFLDGPDATARDAVRVVFAGEIVFQEDLFAAPDLEESKATPTCTVVNLDALVRMKLTLFRDRDRMHLRDLTDVGLLDSSWAERLPTGPGAAIAATPRSSEG